jgi:hypothetical protein
MATMTEDEWIASNDPYPMHRPCRRIIREHPRKGRLFAVACCRRIWHLLADPRSRAAVEVAEEYAEGRATKDQLQAAAAAAQAAHADAFRARGKVGASAEWAAEFTAAVDAWFAATHASNFAYVAAGDGLRPGPEHTAQAHLLRCVFGPLPFRVVLVERSWLKWNRGMVTRLATTIYDEFAFDRLPILADALEEAGCTDADILGHCRSDEAHTRGCWPVDLILDKA